MATQITSYKVVRYGNSGNNLGAYIHCYDPEGTLVMSCTFWDDEANIPVNELQSSGRVRLYYPTSSFGSILHLLQSEEPMFFNFIESNSVGFLTTNEEEVGEEEGA